MELKQILQADRCGLRIQAWTNLNMKKTVRSCVGKRKRAGHYRLSGSGENN